MTGIVPLCGVVTSARTVTCCTCWASRTGCPLSWRKARMLIGSPASWYGRAQLHLQEGTYRPSLRGMYVICIIGLNSGEVVVRAIGNDLHMDYSAVGQPT